MTEKPYDKEPVSAESNESVNRRLFLRSLGKWSGAAIIAAVVGAASFGSSPDANAGVWINRRGPRGGWINRGGWVNRGGWINRAGGWINRGPSSWINRRRPGGGSWINRW